ncbi:nucleosome assembly protein 1-like 4 [Stigmatopora argus]
MDVTRAGKGEPGLQNPAGPTDKTANLHALESVLPKAVKRRVHALKRLQVQCVNIEAKFYEEVHLLERKYADLCRPIYDKRRDIVTAAVEPTDAECEWTSDKDEEDELSDQIKKMIAIDTKMEDSPSVEDPKGIPDFWLTIFRNADMLTDMIQEHDEPILKHLKDVQVKFSEAGKPMSFTLEFYFEPNCYFNNAVLTKVYKMKFEPDTSEPFSFEGPEIVDCVGCMIDWHKGKDVTVKTIKKKQKHKGRGTVRTVTKQVPNPSFFNFFNPVKVIFAAVEVGELGHEWVFPSWREPGLHFYDSDQDPVTWLHHLLQDRQKDHGSLHVLWTSFSKHFTIHSVSRSASPLISCHGSPSHRGSWNGLPRTISKGVNLELVGTIFIYVLTSVRRSGHGFFISSMVFLSLGFIVPFVCSTSPTLLDIGLVWA